MGAEFDTHELDEFAERMVRFYTKEYPKETRNYLQREGNKFKKQLKANTIAAVKGEAGEMGQSSNYSRQRAQKRGDGYQVRVKNKAPHAWLFEHGHEVFTYDRGLGRSVDRGRRAEGRFPAAKTVIAFKGEFYKDTLDWVDNMLDDKL